MSKIFISYRRTDSMETTGRIFDRLLQAFGRKNVFKDVDNIPPGVDFEEYIEKSLRSCETVLVIMGDRWLNPAKPGGRPRLFDKADFVRLEIEAALKSQAQVIPILIRGKNMPSAMKLPEGLKPLTRINAIKVRGDPDFNRDMDLIIRTIRSRRLGARRLPWIAAAVCAIGIGFLGLKGLLPFSVTQHGEQTSTTDAPLDPQHDNQTTAHQAIPSDPVGDVGGGGDLAEIADRQQPEAQEPAVQPIVDGTLSVDSNPTDASVRMGGRSIGRTPLRRQPVSPGDQRIVIEKLGYEAEVRDIEILSSQDTHLSIDLKALTYSLTVITQPDVAEVLLNGERVGTSPCTFDDLRAGRYPIAIRKQGYDAVQETMQIGLGGQTRFEVVLELQTSQLTIQIIPSGLIYVDSDRKTGDTNATYVTTVVPGSYEITAVHLSWGRWVKRIEVLPDENRELIFDFSREIPVTVVSTPPNAAIIVNGRPTGRYTPSVLHMRPGQKDIEVARNGYRSREGVQELTLEAPLSGPIKFELVKMP